MRPSNARRRTIPEPRGLVLASSSPYRRELLQRLGLPFVWQAPDVDEKPRPDESADRLVSRLAEAKARSLAAEFPSHLIVGGDQLGVLQGAILGKPHTARGAVSQLEAANGRAVTFLTGVCVLDSQTKESFTEVVSCRAVFRRLTAEQIAVYVDTEQPLDCAGSFKAEGLGIALFERIEMTDPTVLTGLPLITLVKLLQRHGLDVFA